MKYFVKSIPRTNIFDIYRFLYTYIKFGYYSNHLKKKGINEIRNNRFIRFLSEKIKTNNCSVTLSNHIYPVVKPFSRIVLTNHSLRHIAGTEIWVYQMSRALHNKGFELIIYTGNKGRMSEKLEKNGLFVTSQIEDVINFKPDLIHLHHSPSKKIRELLRCLDDRIPIFNLVHGVAPPLELPLIDSRKVVEYGAVSALVASKISFLTRRELKKIHIVRNFSEHGRFNLSKLGPIKKAAIVSAKVNSLQYSFYQSLFNKIDVSLDIYGTNEENKITDMKSTLDSYDLVLCTGKTVIDVMGVGKRAMLLEGDMLGASVVYDNLELLSKMNYALASHLVPAIHVNDVNILNFLKEEINKLYNDDIYKTNKYLSNNNSINSVAKILCSIYAQIVQR